METIGGGGLTVYRPQDAVTYTGPDDDGNGLPDIRQIDFAKLTTYGLYQNRNRTYAPVMGRFLQRDPNASGQVTLSDMDWFGGMMQPSPWAGTPDVMAMYGDGMSLHGYAGSNPLSISDASGLFGFLDIGIGTSSLEGMYQDNADRAISVGQSIYDGAGGLFRSAAIFQYADMEWASDWSASDDDYSSSGVSYAAGYRGGGESGGYGHAMAGLLSPGDRGMINGLAAASNHGSRSHYRAMGAMAIEQINDLLKNGKIGSIAELDFGKMFNRGHSSLGKLRPDVTIRTVKDQLLFVGEIGNSQSAKALSAKVDKLRTILGNKVKIKGIKI